MVSGLQIQLDLTDNKMTTSNLILALLLLNPAEAAERVVDM